MKQHGRSSHAARMIVIGLALCGLTVGAGLASAFEVIPAVGVTKSTDDNAGDAQGYFGLSLRAPVLPYLKLEGTIGYRQDRFAGGDLKVRQWPITASAWAFPTPILYAGGGLGWYRTTFDYSNAIPIRDDTRSKMGLHVGGGADFPLSPKLGLDINGRYIFMQRDDETLEVPTTFNPDFWSLSAGLAFQF